MLFDNFIQNDVTENRCFLHGAKHLLVDDFDVVILLYQRYFINLNASSHIRPRRRNINPYGAWKNLHLRIHILYSSKTTVRVKTKPVWRILEFYVLMDHGQAISRSICDWLTISFIKSLWTSSRMIFISPAIQFNHQYHFDKIQITLHNNLNLLKEWRRH